MKELEAEIYCPSCHHLYGQVYRHQVGEGVWEHKTLPSTVPTYCGICECVLERKPYAG